MGQNVQTGLTRSIIERGSESSTTGTEGTLTSLPELARSLLHADYAAVTVIDRSGYVRHMYYAGISEQQAEAIGPPPVGKGVLGRLGRRDGVLNLEKISDHPDSSGFPERHPPMQALLGVQVRADEGYKANLYVANGPGKPSFTDEDEVKLSALANYVRLALENERLYNEEARSRNRAESAERRLEAVIRGSSAGVLVVDVATGTIAYASSEARRLTGLNLRAGAGRDTYEVPGVFRRPDGTEISISDLPLHRAISERAPVGPVEMTFIKPDGRQSPALVSAAPIFNIYGDIDTAVTVFLDMSRIKEVDEVRNEFLSMITHDLRSPLATIKGLNTAATNAFEEGAQQEVKAHLGSIYEEVDYLTELVSNLLDMSRIESGADVFDFEVCHMADIAQDVISRIRRSREGSGREIHMNVPASLPPIFADPAQVGRVLSNLVTNALKYSENGIEITSRLDPKLNLVRTEVRDSGPGIPAERTQDIFDKFARLKTGKSRGREGSGLGLAICKSIVESHDGEIGVNSIEGEGSVFWFGLPAEQRR